MNHWSIDNLNYARDRRNCERAKAPVLFLGDEEIELPVKWEVCPVCQGAGNHVNPAIDCGGVTAEQFEDDPDFAENYYGGMYDVQCNYCGGRTTVQEVDWNQLPAEQAKAYRKQLAEEAADRAAYLAEIKAGAGA